MNGIYVVAILLSLCYLYKNRNDIQLKHITLCSLGLATSFLLSNKKDEYTGGGKKITKNDTRIQILKEVVEDLVFIYPDSLDDSKALETILKNIIKGTPYNAAAYGLTNSNQVPFMSRSLDEKKSIIMATYNFIKRTIQNMVKESKKCSNPVLFAATNVWSIPRILNTLTDVDLDNKESILVALTNAIVIILENCLT
jgi:hypothetical protein